MEITGESLNDDPCDEARMLTVGFQCWIISALDGDTPVRPLRCIAGIVAIMILH